MIEFTQFLKELKTALETGDEAQIRNLLESVENTSDEARDFIREILAAHRIRIRVYCNDSLLEASALEADGGIQRVSGITPGTYSLESATGQLLWEAELGIEDLVWSAAFPTEPLPLAASSDEISERFSLSETLMEGALRLDVSPGLINGEILLRNCRFLR